MRAHEMVSKDVGVRENGAKARTLRECSHARIRVKVCL
jgi:hypothetical protein